MMIDLDRPGFGAVSDDCNPAEMLRFIHLPALCYG
jgi:hypothetical protein